MTALRDLEQGDMAAFTFITGPDGSLALETAADDCTVLVRSDVHGLPEATPVSVTARVEKVIRADVAVDYLVLDVREVRDHEPEQPGTEETATEDQPRTLDSIAAYLVGEVRVRRRERNERPAVVTDAAGERDRADATTSSERERAIRTGGRDST
ncbi:hypothetical protein [Halorientalis marina]|uniref:hypothetical protein n=1 Tax=Halorientalis marina TaxID=2931976 RepID=UPI001FF502A8|nr:hypothetical protein [Halorientalis marina]